MQFRRGMMGWPGAEVGLLCSINFRLKIEYKSIIIILNDFMPMLREVVNFRVIPEETVSYVTQPENVISSLDANEINKIFSRRNLTYARLHDTKLKARLTIKDTLKPTNNYFILISPKEVNFGYKSMPSWDITTFYWIDETQNFQG